jgi:hypothetical protein
MWGFQHDQDLANILTIIFMFLIMFKLHEFIIVQFFILELLWNEHE